MFSDGRPIFLQIAEMIENDIVAGSLGEESQVPSTNEFAAMYRINPATAAKGINLLVEDGILHKRRGIGMFVSPGARERLMEKRRARFSRDYLEPMLVEAASLGLTSAELHKLIDEVAPHLRETPGLQQGTPTAPSPERE